MATVYRVLADENYQSLEPADPQAFNAARRGTWRFDGFKVEGPLERLVVRSGAPALPRPDVWRLANTLAFEERAWGELVTFFDQSCQTFKLPFEGRTLFVMNVTYVIQCLDRKASVLDPAGTHAIRRFAFHEDRLDYSLFKIPQTATHDIYTVEGLAAPDDEFKPVVEKFAIKGLRFEQIWRGGGNGRGK